MARSSRSTTADDPISISWRISVGQRRTSVTTLVDRTRGLRDLVLSGKVTTEEKLREYVEHLKSDPHQCAVVREHFAQSWQKLDEAGKQAAYELHLLEPP